MITPLGKNVLGTLIKTDGRTKTGLYLGETAAQQLAPKIAEIISVGPEVKSVKKGDKVVFKPYATYEVKEGEDEYVMLEEVDILGITTDDKK